MYRLSDLMMTGIRICTRQARRHWRDYQRIKRTKRNFSRNNLLLQPMGSSSYVKRTQEYWRRNYGKPINPIWHIAISAVTGVEDERFIPQDIWFEEVLPKLNDMRMREVYRDKNLARTLLRPESEVSSVLKVMHGKCYSNEGKLLAPSEVDCMIRAYEGDVILKGAGTDNGEGVRLASMSDGKFLLRGTEMTLAEISASYGQNFTVQRRIGQHHALAAPHPNSLNTVRIVTLRWGGEIYPLLAFVRMGVDDSITDNAGTGGICRGVGSDGRLSPYAVDAFGGKYAAHPSTGYDFTQEDVLPAYDRLRKYAVELHERVFHFDLVSWDFVIDETETPIFLEMNFMGASYVYQFACGVPIFGDLTNAVLALVGRGVSPQGNGTYPTSRHPQ